LQQPPYRILLLTSTAAIGGAEQVALSLARGCDRSRFSVRIASLSGPPLLIEKAREGGVEATHWTLEGGRRAWRLDHVLGAIGRDRAAGVDLVQTFGLTADLVGRLFKRRFGGAKLLCAIHSTDAWRGGLKIRLDRWSAGKADAFVSVSEIGKRIRVEREGLPASKIVVIPNGIDVRGTGEPKPREGWLRELGLTPEAAPIILHVANLRPMKGHGETLAAARAVLKQYPKSVFLLVGRDESGGEYERQARAEGLAGRVRFLGYRADPRELMRQADIFILPSYYEGRPISILEAMAEGCPIIASDVGGIPEQVRDGEEALLIEPRRADRLAEAIVRLAGDEGLRRRLAAAARRRVEADFTESSMCKRYERLFEAMIEGRPLPGA
jgi:glycosyltransferase involved in cell wall biosynthesis